MDLEHISTIIERLGKKLERQQKAVQATQDHISALQTIKAQKGAQGR